LLSTRSKITYNDKTVATNSFNRTITIIRTHASFILVTAYWLSKPNSTLCYASSTSTSRLILSCLWPHYDSSDDEFHPAATPDHTRCALCTTETRTLTLSAT
jgi:hypothetical protein